MADPLPIPGTRGMENVRDMPEQVFGKRRVVSLPEVCTSWHRLAASVLFIAVVAGVFDRISDAVLIIVPKLVPVLRDKDTARIDRSARKVPLERAHFRLVLRNRRSRLAPTCSANASHFIIDQVDIFSPPPYVSTLIGHVAGRQSPDEIGVPVRLRMIGLYGTRFFKQVGKRGNHILLAS
jgi:hypothetical protein